MGKTLYEKVFDLHTVKKLSENQYQLFIGLHLIHEVTSPQAFSILAENSLPILFPNRNFATVDHIIPTILSQKSRPFVDAKAEEMLDALEKNTAKNNIRFFPPGSSQNGIVHVIGPENGLTQPGMTIACGDSHTATHGAMGCLAFGVGTSQIADILATQTMRVEKLKVRKISISGKLNAGVTAKDVILSVINKLGVKAGVGYAYEYSGAVIDSMSMEERMTVCNMSIEGGAKIGYCNPDQITYDYLHGKPFVPQGKAYEERLFFWKSMASDKDASYTDALEMDGNELSPRITWGITPEQSIPIDGTVPAISSFPQSARPSIQEAFDYMGFQEGRSIQGTPVNVVFIGSCTNGRLSDLQQAAAILKGRKISPGILALAVPGSEQVKLEAEKIGLDEIFKSSGFQWREPGCSMCLAMNPDKLSGTQISASTSNRNFKGRQGSPRGRTLLVSPLTAAATAIQGKIADPRDFL